MSDDTDKPTSLKDRTVNNLEISGWLFSPVEQANTVKGQAYLKTKLMTAHDKPLVDIKLWINKNTNPVHVQEALGHKEGDNVVVTGELEVWTFNGRVYVGVNARSIE